MTSKTPLYMHTPPSCQGQAVTRSYGSDGTYAYRRTEDASDRTTRWERADWDSIWEATPEGTEHNWDPLNSEPSLPPDVAWEPCEDPTR